MRGVGKKGKRGRMKKKNREREEKEKRTRFSQRGGAMHIDPPFVTDLIPIGTNCLPQPYSHLALSLLYQRCMTLREADFIRSMLDAPLTRTVN